MSITIRVTPGESALIAALGKRQISFQRENLLVGDIHICRDDQPVIVIERKAKGDLAASIKDGRYHEQKSRLFQTGIEPQRIIYIIERIGTPTNIEWGAICNTQYRDRCTVFQTKSVEETADYIYYLSRSIEKFYTEKPEEQSACVQVNIKKKSCAADEWFVTALTLIPKVSINVAQVIVEKYPKLSELKRAFDEQGHIAVSELKFGASGRRIGEKLSKEIIQFINLNW